LGNWVSVNIHKFTPDKLVYLKRRLANYDIVFLQEINGKKNLSQWYTRRLGFDDGIYSIVEAQAKGVALLWRSPWTRKGEIIKDDQGRIVGTSLSNDVCGLSLNAFSVYAPNLDSSLATGEAYSDFMISLGTHLDMVPRNPNTIVTGDFNLIMCKLMDSFTPKPIVYPIAKECVLECMGDRGLHDLFRALNGSVRAFTYKPGGKNANHTYNRIDYAWVSEDLMEKIQSCSHVPFGRTDHKAVELNLGTKERTPGLWRHNDAHNSNTELQIKLQETIKQAAKEAGDLNPAQRFEYIKFKIKGASRKWAIEAVAEDKSTKEKALKVLTDANPDLHHEEITEAQAQLDRITAKELDHTISKANVQYVEEGEKCTAYFFACAKKRAANSNINELRFNGVHLKTATEVNHTLYTEHEALYAAQAYVAAIWDWASLMPRISNEEKRASGKPITKGECTKALFQKMKVGKSPGNDGLTVGLYRTLWPWIADHFMATIWHALRTGELAKSQTQSVIRLILKKGKDPLDLKSWRPISLMNVDVKILSKALTARLEKVAASLVGEDQHAFVEGRNIHHGTRLMQQAIESLERTGGKGAIIAIDFRKAFDTIDHEYIWACLESAGLDYYFIAAVRTLYAKAESAVINHGTTTKYFSLSRGCRQGDPIAPLLFVIALAPLIRKLKLINPGVALTGGQAQNAAFADDLSVATDCPLNAARIMDTVESFGTATGLRINRDKSEMITFGKWSPEEKRLVGVREVNHLKITGLVIGRSSSRTEIERLNFEPAVEKLRQKLGFWKIRGLSLLGRVTALKAHGFSQIQYLANATMVPDTFIKEITKITANFLYKGTDKIQRVKAAKAIADGGIGVPLVTDMVAAAAIHWARDASVSEAVWAKTMMHEITQLGGFETAQGDYMPEWHRPLSKISPHTKYVLSKLAHLSKQAGMDKTICTDSPIHYNKQFATIRGKRAAPRKLGRLYRSGVTRVIDFFDADGRLLTAREASNRGLPKGAWLEWHGTTQIIKGKWPDLKIEGRYRTYGPTPPVSQPPQLRVGDCILAGSDLKQGTVLKRIAKHRECRLTPHQQRLQAIGVAQTGKDWEAIYKTTLRHSISTRTRAKLFQLFSTGLYTNHDYHRFGHLDSPACQLCDHCDQTFLHLFLECEEVNSLKDRLTAQWDTPIGEADWLGRERPDMDRGKHFLALELTLYIHRANWARERPSIQAFKARVRGMEKIEKTIAIKRGKTATHEAKWASILRLM